MSEDSVETGPSNFDHRPTCNDQLVITEHAQKTTLMQLCMHVLRTNNQSADYVNDMFVSVRDHHSIPTMPHTEDRLFLPRFELDISMGNLSGRVPKCSLDLIVRAQNSYFQ